MLLLFALVVAVAARDIADLGNKDLQPEETQRKIRDIIRSHEDYKYGQHGGHDYDEAPPKVDRKGEYAPDYQLHYKNGPGHKGLGYYVIPTKKHLGGISRKSKPVNPKVFNYYPKIDPKEQYDGSTREYAYYPEKKSILLDNAGYPVHHDKEYVSDDYAVPAEDQPLHYPDSEPHDHQSSYGAAHPEPYGNLNTQPVVYAPVAHHHDYAPDEPHSPKKHYIIHEQPKYAAISPSAHVQLNDHQHAIQKHKEADYQDHGHKYHGDHGEEKLQEHHQHKDYEEEGHNSHAAHAAQADHHSKYHDKGSYERDRGYHYEKAYAYDRIRAHHDIGKSHDSHAAYKDHHSHQGHHKKGKQGGHSFMYFKKGDNYGSDGYGKSGHHADKYAHYKKAHDYSSHSQPVPPHYR